MANRERSRSDADNWVEVPYGSISAGSIQRTDTHFETDFCNANSTNKSHLEAQVLRLDSVEIPLSGCVHPTQISGYWRYDATKIIAKAVASQGAILERVIARNLGPSLPSTTRRLCVMYGNSTMTDVVTPNFGGRSAKGDVIMSPMSQSSSMVQVGVSGKSTNNNLRITSFSVGATSGSLATQRLKLFINIAWDAHGFAALGLTNQVLGAFVQGTGVGSGSFLDYQAAVNDAFAKVYEAELDIPVIVAEINKTVSMVRSALTKLTKITLAIKKAMKLQVSAASKDFADLWLEYRYGWTPLLGDVRKALSLLSDGRGYTPRRTFRGFDGDEDVNTIDFTYTSGTYSYRFVGTHTVKRDVRAGVLTQINLGTSFARDFGFINAPATAWELLPYSFVVDWFVNVGGFLATLNPTPTVETKGSWATQILEESFSGIVTVTELNLSQSEDLSFRGQWKRKQRTVDVGQTFINVDIDINPERILDSIALLLKARR